MFQASTAITGLGLSRSTNGLWSIDREVFGHFAPCRSIAFSTWLRGAACPDGFYCLDLRLAQHPPNRSRRTAAACAPETRSPASFGACAPHVPLLL